MYESFVGDRIRLIREEIYEMKQSELADEINSYIKKHPKEFQDALLLNQPKLSFIEQKSRMSKESLFMLINFFYEDRRINPAWIMIKDNKAMPKFLTKLVIDSSLVEKQQELQEYAKKINQTINDISIVIDNSVF